MTKPVTLRFTADPGHGWLHVKRDTARMILGEDFAKITSFSYQRGATIYLEEDQDAYLFMQALGEQGVPYTVNIVHTNKLSPIRSYASFYP